jgi:hypothetical protein
VCLRCRDLQAAGASEDDGPLDEDDDESPCALEEGTGYWRQRRGVQEWVPLLVEPEPEVVEDPDIQECAYRNCGAWFVVRRPGHLYCSEKCQHAAAYIQRAGVAA